MGLPNPYLPLRTAGQDRCYGAIIMSVRITVDFIVRYKDVKSRQIDNKLMPHGFNILQY